MRSASLSVYVHLACTKCQEWCDAATWAGAPLCDSLTVLGPFVAFHGQCEAFKTYYDDHPDGWLEWTRENYGGLMDRERCDYTVEELNAGLAPELVLEVLGALNEGFARVVERAFVEQLAARSVLIHEPIHAECQKLRDAAIKLDRVDRQGIAIGCVLAVVVLSPLAYGLYSLVTS